MLAVLPGKGPTFNTDYLPIFLEIIVKFRCGFEFCGGVYFELLFRCKHGLPLVADDKGKTVKKKNLQVIATLMLSLPIQPMFIICNHDFAHDSFTGELWIINVRRRSRRRCSIPTVMQV